MEFGMFILALLAYLKKK
ncbi:hypothetical protein [Paenibacillus sp. E194]